MYRNQNHQFNNGNAQGRPVHVGLCAILRRQFRDNWLTTILGLIGLIAGIVVIIGNEARAVQISKSLEESIGLVTPVSPEGDLDESLAGKPVYLTGVMTIHEPLTEPDYGISVLAVKLLRNVQMYQWVESESDIIDREGNPVTTQYHYYTEWRNTLVDSNYFSSAGAHGNPKEFPIKRQTQINENVRIGRYRLGLELKKKFTDFVPVTSDERPERQDIKLHAGLYYHCQDIWNPEVGDVRIQFSYAGHHGQVISVIAKLDNTLTLVPYSSKSGVNVLILRLGQYSVEDMFALEHSQNKFLTWMYRGAGWLLLYVSCVCLSTFLQILVSHCSLLEEVLPISHSSLKMTVSMCMSLMATALAWVWYRPVLGAGLVAVTISLLYFNRWFSGAPPRPRYNRL